MGTYEELKAAIQQVIRTNGNNEITGALLRNALLSIVNVVGANATFAGIATPNTNPGTADQNVFYLATEAGTYVNFDGIVINEGEAVILTNKSGSWAKNVSGFAKQKQLTELSYDFEKEVENIAPIEGILTKAEIDIKGELKDGYYALNGSGFVGGGGSYLSTDLLRVIPQEILRVKSWVTSPIVASISFYDKSKIPLVSEFRGTMEKSTIEVIVPNGAYYIAVCCVKSDIYSLEVWASRNADVNVYTKEQVQGFISSLKKDVDFIAETTLAEESENIVIETYDYKQDGSNGYWASETANFNKDDSRRATQKLSVKEGQSYLITTIIRPTSISAVVFYDENYNNVGRWRTGTGTEEHLVDEILIIPQGVAYIAVNSANPISPSVKLVAKEMVFAAYNKRESDVRYEKKGGSVTKYGLSWSLEDFSELGKREFGSVGTSAVSAIGNADGYSDYDNIYPWSEMRRCNLRVTDNGAKVVVYEGEDGFALDGSNGDVFVRIPKFKTNRYTHEGRMYVVIGEGYTHPLFIENGVELDEVFVGAFESSVVENKMYSRSNVIPTNNIKGADFLDAAKARGNGYTLFDMRAIDAIWRLMAVEYGCRNSNQIIGYGYSDYRQAVQDYDYLIANQNISQSNIIKLNASTSAYVRLVLLSEFATGNNILFCKGEQRNILAERKITNVEYDDVTNELVITFDGTPIDITTDIFVGNAPCDCNYCETISQEYAMGWHTGRTNRPPLDGAGKSEIAMNPCRYRWIENPVGNVWHMLPDVKFFDRQLYMCNDIMSYNFNENKDNYIPYGNILPLQTSNGNKNDVNISTTPNFWMTKMMNDTFAKGSSFGNTYDTEHNGLLSTMGFGGYYYLNDGFRMIVAGGGFDHLWRSNILTFRAWYSVTDKWYLYGARLMFKNLSV